MLTAEEIQSKARNKFPDFLRSLITGETFFPYPIRFGKPSPTAHLNDLIRDFAALRVAASSLGFRVIWEPRKTTRWHIQDFPETAFFDDEQTYLSAIGRTREVAAFKRNLALSRQLCPELEGSLASFAVKIVENEEVWPDVLKVCRYFVDHPQPRLYPRQLPIGVHSKFVDWHHDILRSTLDFLLGEQVDGTAKTFEDRYHLLRAEAQVRLRFLDNNLREAAGFPVPDVAIPRSAFQFLSMPASTCLVVENRMIFLTLPPLLNTVAILGDGKAAALLNGTEWFSRCRLVYWGDIDDSGFRILSALRAAGHPFQSLLMDLQTWKQFEHLSHPGKHEVGSVDLRLEEAELRAWESVTKAERMLEQEHLPQSVVDQALHRIIVETN
jgi:hypothetical protein